MGNAFIKKNRKQHFSVVTIVRVGLLLAISVVLKLVLEIYVPIAGLPALRVNLTSIPIMLSGIICGPFAGLVTGALSDILGFLIKPAGIFFPGFTLSNALVGFIPGMIYKYVKRDMKFNIINTIFILLISMGFIGVLITSGVVSVNDGMILYNGKEMSWIIPVLFIILTLAYIYIPIKASSKVTGIKMDKILFSVSVTQLITSIILNTYFLSILLGKGVLVLLPGRIFSNYIFIPVYAMFVALLLKSIGKYNH